MEDISKERKGIDVFLTSDIGGIKKRKWWKNSRKLFKWK